MSKFSIFQKIKEKKGYSLIEVVFIFIVVGAIFLILPWLHDDVQQTKEQTTSHSIDYKKVTKSQPKIEIIE